MEFVLVRHGQPEWIRDGLNVDDPPLTELGHQQAQAMAAGLLEEGIYVTGFFYPVVPQGQARIRTQMSAAHTREHLDHAIAAFTKVGRQLGVIAG